jgi:hypothetical protein
MPSTVPLVRYFISTVTPGISRGAGVGVSVAGGLEGKVQPVSKRQNIHTKITIDFVFKTNIPFLYTRFYQMNMVIIHHFRDKYNKDIFLLQAFY